MAFDEKRFFQELEQLVNIDSGSYDIPGLEKVADELTRMYRELGMFVDRMELGESHRPHIFACTKDPASLTGERPIDILFIGHFDTVFPEGTVAQRPYSTDGNRAYGPGVADMKSGDLLAIHLLKELIEKYPDAVFAVSNNSDEELGSPDSGEFLKELASKAKYGFDMEPGRETGNFVYERKGCCEYWVDIEGISSHAGIAPDKGASAVQEMARWIRDLEKMHKTEPGRTLCVGIAQGGTASNVVPDHAHMKLDLRYMDEGQRDRTEAFLDELVATPYIPRTKAGWIRFSEFPPMRLIPETQHMADILKEEAEKMGYAIGFESSAGASDASLVSAGGTPIIDACGGHGGGAHGVGEYLEIETVAKRYQLLMATIGRLVEEK